MTPCICWSRDRSCHSARAPRSRNLGSISCRTGSFAFPQIVATSSGKS